MSAMLLVGLLVATVVVWPRRRRRREAVPLLDQERRLGALAAGEGRAVSVWGAVLRRVPGAAAVARRRAGGPGGWVADFAEVVAIGLDAGLALDAACDVAASVPSVTSAVPRLRELLVAAGARGAGVGEAMSPLVQPVGAASRVAQGSDAEDLCVLLAAWRLSEHLGTPAATVTATAARSVRERRAARDRLEVAASGPRTSMTLLSCLPLLGPLGGAAVGVGPTRLYDGVAGTGALVLGGVLTMLGWWWGRSLLRSACRPALTGRGQRGDRVPGSASWRGSAWRP